MPKTKDKRPEDYVDNKKFTKAVIEYANSYRDAIELEEEPPQISNYIGECVLLISKGMSSRPNFSGYSYKDEMIGDGIENVFQYLHNFDPIKQDLKKIFCNILVDVNDDPYEEIINIKDEEEAVKYLKTKFPIESWECGTISSSEEILIRLNKIKSEDLEDLLVNSFRATQKPKFSLKRMNSIKTANAFAYVSQMVYFAFVRRLNKEQKQQHLKEKVIESVDTHVKFFDVQELDDTVYNHGFLESLQSNLEMNYQVRQDKKKKKGQEK